MPRTNQTKFQAGDRFGELTLLYPSVKPHYWAARCSCGTTKEYIVYSLSAGNTKSCGCLRKAHSGRIGRYARARLKPTILEQDLLSDPHAIPLPGHPDPSVTITAAQALTALRHHLARYEVHVSKGAITQDASGGLKHTVRTTEIQDSYLHALGAALMRTVTLDGIKAKRSRSWMHSAAVQVAITIDKADPGVAAKALARDQVAARTPEEREKFLAGLGQMIANAKIIDPKNNPNFLREKPKGWDALDEGDNK
jgi:hypothetical protein